MEIEEDLKHRLVGVIVITSLVAIFLPLLFDEPLENSEEEIHILEIPKQPIDTSALQLPETVEEVITPQYNPPSKPVVNQSNIDLRGWFVQVGNFSDKSNALDLQTKLRKENYAVMIKQAKSAKGLFYKVRVGPERNKQSAEKLKAQLKANQKLDGMLISS